MEKSSRWGTRDTIEKIAHGVVLEESAIEVDEFEVASDIPGLTERNFIPHHHYGVLNGNPHEVHKLLFDTSI